MGKTIATALALASMITGHAWGQGETPTTRDGRAYVAIPETVRDSNIPAEVILAPTMDGLYTAIGLRKPPGEGPFPIVLFARGNGGGGMEYIRDMLQNASWTQEEFLRAGYAVAWLRYRTEVQQGYNNGGALERVGNQDQGVLNRSPLDHEDVVAAIEFVKTLPYVDSDRVGYMGMSHGGEMAFKIASEYNGLRAIIASEPANVEYLARRPDAARRELLTGAGALERMTAQAREDVDLAIARQRIGMLHTPIFVQGRDLDDLQGIFKLSYDLLRESGKETEWKTYLHDVHGFVYVHRNSGGRYEPDPVQREAVADSIAWFDRYLKEDAAARATGSGIEYSQPFYND
jgi:dienelactone hydrolase